MTLQESNERLTDCLQIREDRDLLEKQNNLYIESLRNYQEEVGRNHIVITSLIAEGKKLETSNSELKENMKDCESKVQALRTQRNAVVIITAVLSTILIIKR